MEYVFSSAPDAIFFAKKGEKGLFQFFQEDLLKISKFNGFNFGVCSGGFLDDALFPLFLHLHFSLKNIFPPNFM